MITLKIIHFGSERNTFVKDVESEIWRFPPTKRKKKKKNVCCTWNQSVRFGGHLSIIDVFLLPEMLFLKWEINARQTRDKSNEDEKVGHFNNGGERKKWKSTAKVIFWADAEKEHLVDGD